MTDEEWDRYFPGRPKPLRAPERKPLPVRAGLSPGMREVLREHRRRHRAGENPVVIYWIQSD
jgi:hypothetical protein